MRLPRRPILLRVGIAILPLLACGLFEPDDPAGMGTVTGTLTNTTDRPVAGVAVRLAGATGFSYQGTTGADGSFSMTDVRDDDYTFTAEASGYTTHTEAVRIAGSRSIDRTLFGPNAVSGAVVNSQNGQSVAGAVVTFSRNGLDELVVSTSAAGVFDITNAPGGSFRMCIRKQGFLDFCRDGVAIAGGSFAIDPVALAEVPPPGSFRVVLSWGATPSDLDAHLTVSPESGSRVHLYYANRSAGGATLDRDDQNGTGPETITFPAPVAALVRFSVHNFSDQSTAGGAGIAASATVSLYTASGLLKTWRAPAAPAGGGNTWRVFEVISSGPGSLGILDNNGQSLGYVQASSSGDAGAFLTGGDDAPEVPKPPTL